MLQLFLQNFLQPEAYQVIEHSASSIPEDTKGFPANIRQSLALDFHPNRDLEWPSIFEERLNSLRDFTECEPPLKTQGRSKPKDATDGNNIQFMGTGIDLEDDFNALGWLNALPDQYGIPGWQRITFMKHFAEDLGDVDSDNLWAYEGVVLPGGRIIVGRWWFASERVDFDVSNKTLDRLSTKSVAYMKTEGLQRTVYPLGCRT